MSRRRLFAIAFLAAVAVAGIAVAEEDPLAAGVAGFTGARMGIGELAFGSLVAPGRTFKKLRGATNGAALGWGMTIGYGVMYAQTALVLGLKNVEPFHPHPLNPTPDEKFYLVQAGHTVPSSAAFMGAGYGAAYGLVRLFGAEVDPGTLWAAYSTAVIMPTFVTMWIPETTAALALRNPQNLGWPQWVDIGRQVAGVAWSIALSAVAVAVVSDVAWWQAGIIGTIATGVTGTLFGMIYR